MCDLLITFRIFYPACSTKSDVGNPHTRRAYALACHQFFAWCEQRGLTLIRPYDVAAYLQQLQNPVSVASVKQQLAAYGCCSMACYGLGRADQPGVSCARAQNMWSSPARRPSSRPPNGGPC